MNYADLIRVAVLLLASALYAKIIQSSGIRTD